MFELAGFDHIQITIPRSGEQTAREFYGGLLGLPETPKPFPLSERGGLWFCNETTHIHLGIEENFTPEKKGHPAILVRGLQALIDRLTERSVPFEITKELPDRFRIYVHDPFGNRLEFIEDGDGFRQKRS